MDPGTRHPWQQVFDTLRDAVEEAGVRADQQGLRVLVMLGLGKQVHGNPVGIRLTIAYHQYFRGAGNHVDTDLAKHHALGGRHVGIARADNLVDGRHGGRAVGQCGNGLCPADSEHPVDACDGRRRQHHVIDGTIRCRHDHHQFPDTGHLGRNGIHQDR